MRLWWKESVEVVSGQCRDVAASRGGGGAFQRRGS